MIKVNELIALFQKALSEKWGYIWGAAGESWTQAKQNAATREQTVKLSTALSVPNRPTAGPTGAS